MSPTGQIREAFTQPGRQLNDAVRYYADHNVDVSDAIKAEPILYGELARSALLWTAELLVAIEEAAGSRPAARAPADVLMERVAAYLEASSRWPAVPHLMHPLQLIIPAYYAVRGAELSGFHVQPPLLLVEYDEPLELMEEVLGRGPSMTIRQHKNADLESMPKAVEDAPEHEPPTFRSFLSARERDRLHEARSAAQRPPAEAAPVDRAEPMEAPAEEADSERASLWTSRLRDSRITLREENSFDPGYSGGSTFYSVQTFLDLFDGGRYRLEETIISSISGPGFTGGGEPRITESWGEWSVRSRAPTSSSGSLATTEARRSTESRPPVTERSMWMENVAAGRVSDESHRQAPVTAASRRAPCGTSSRV
jgi:hypothetical protein